LLRHALGDDRFVGSKSWGAGMRAFLIWIITAIAVALAIALVPGIEVWGYEQILDGNQVVSIAVLAAVLALLNVFIKPILQVISLPITCLTLGLFALVLNTIMLYLAAWISNLLGAGIYIDGFFSALLASIVVSIVTAVLNAITGINDPQSKDK
jgi:putative membrane protein